MEQQPENFLLELIRYNNWANAQIIAACQGLSAEQRVATVPGTYGNIHATLGHIIYAEADYVGRLTGTRPQPSFKWDKPPSIDELAVFACLVAEALLDTVQRTPLTQIVHEEDDGIALDYQARALFIQIINHGVEHRTNITTILSSLGLTAPDVDGWGYLWAHPDKFEAQEGIA